MKPLQLVITLFFVMLLTFSLFGKGHKIRVRQHTETYFYQSHFTGSLKAVYRKNGGVGFKLNDGARYVFYPSVQTSDAIISQLEKLSMKANKVFKNPYSDTIYLKTDHSLFFFTSSAGIKVN